MAAVRAEADRREGLARLAGQVETMRARVESIDDGVARLTSAIEDAAGCDLALNCWAKMDDMVGIARALPAINPGATARLASALAATAVPAGPQPERHAELVARRDTLLALAAKAAA